MVNISPVSDLRNYNSVLEKVSPGSPVYLTVNGRGRYAIRDISEDEEFEKTKAMLRLMCELNEGTPEKKRVIYLLRMCVHILAVNANEIQSGIFTISNARP